MIKETGQLNEEEYITIHDLLHNLFHQLGPLGRVGLVVAMCVLVLSFCPLLCDFLEASHWPSGHMISSRPFFSFFCGPKAPWRRRRRRRWGGIKQKCLKASWRRCYYPHRSKELVSPVCGIFGCIIVNGWKSGT